MEPPRRYKTDCKPLERAETQPNLILMHISARLVLFPCASQCWPSHPTACHRHGVPILSHCSDSGPPPIPAHRPSPRTSSTQKIASFMFRVQSNQCNFQLRKLRCRLAAQPPNWTPHSSLHLLINMTRTI